MPSQLEKQLLTYFRELKDIDKRELVRIAEQWMLMVRRTKKGGC